MFFQGDSIPHETMRRLADRLEQLGVPYAVVGAMAVNAHGARRTTDDVDILVTREGFEHFKKELAGKEYERVQGRSRRFVDKVNGGSLDFLIAGLFPGSGRPGPVAFPDPATVSEEIEKLRVIRLPELIELKLAARRFYDFGDVVALIRVHNLDESFADRLHESVRRDYMECLEEKRREDSYESRQTED
jgi:hypothetical protein